MEPLRGDAPDLLPRPFKLLDIGDAKRQRGIFDLDEARQRVSLGIDHRPAQHGVQRSGGAIGADAELLVVS